MYATLRLEVLCIEDAILQTLTVTGGYRCLSVPSNQSAHSLLTSPTQLLLIGYGWFLEGRIIFEHVDMLKVNHVDMYVVKM